MRYWGGQTPVLTNGNLGVPAPLPANCGRYQGTKARGSQGMHGCLCRIARMGRRQWLAVLPLRRPSLPPAFGKQRYATALRHRAERLNYENPKVKCGQFRRPKMTFVDAFDVPGRKTGQIKLHGAAAFESMRRAGRLTAEALDLLVEHVRPGVTTEFLDNLIFDFAIAHGAFPAPLNYRGYRKSICTSINHVVCHGIPDRKPLRDGDIVNVDVTLILDGWHGDFEPYVSRR